MTVIRYSARTGAALLMLGLWAGGAQAIGVASADDSPTDQTAATSVRAPRAISSRSGDGVAKGVRAPAARPAAAVTAPRAVPPARRAATVVRPAAQPAQVSAATTAAASGIATPAPNQATIAVTNWFGDSWSFLNGFNDPLSQALQGALVEVQRRFFSPAPTVKPVQLTSWTPGDPILGALRYIQPGGAAVSFQLASAPTSGTVQLLSDGTYTYTPGAGFTGTDSFTAAVTAAGFNVLDPTAPRTAMVTVNINPAPPVSLTRGFDITNLSGKAVYVQKIIKESGYENAVEAAPSVGQILQPGQSTHVELTRYAFYSYDTRINFAGCADISCTSFQTGPSGPWQVRMYVQLLDTYRGDCNWNNCWNGSSQEIGPWSPNGFYGLDNSVIKLVDRPDTAYTLSGAEGQQQAQVLNTVCTAQGTTCQFVPTANTQFTTKTESVFTVKNPGPGDINVKRSQTDTISATSSFGTTYSSEVSATFGSKDVFNVVAKQTFSSTQSLSNTTSRAATWEVNKSLPEKNQLSVEVEVPVARVTGDYTAVIGNTTYNLTGVYFDFIDPNKPGNLTVNTPVTPLPA